MTEKIANLIFEFEETLFNHDGVLAEGGNDLLIWLRFHKFGVGLVSQLPEESVGSFLEKAGVGEYFDQGICAEQMEELKKDVYLTAREELSEVKFLNMGATEEEAFALAEEEEAYVVTASKEALSTAHEASCFTILLMDEANSRSIPPQVQQKADVILHDLSELQDWLEEQEHKLHIEVEALTYDFAVCKLADTNNLDLSHEFYFASRTDKEMSLVCKSEDVPANVLAIEDGWRAFRVKGTLDFSLVGILSQLTGLLAKYQIGLFAVSTFDTDYILVKKEQYKQAAKVLGEAGFLK